VPETEIGSMDKTAIILGLITLIFLWINLLISVRIINYLKKYNEDASLFNYGLFVRGKIFKYLPLYRKITKEKEGKIGSLYFSFYATFFLAMISLSFGIAAAA